MRYYTKEWFDLMQRAGQTAGLRKVPDKKYTKKDIDALYEKILRRETAAEKKAYNTAPDLSYLLEILDEHGFNADDWVIHDPETGRPRTPSSIEEVKAVILDYAKRDSMILDDPAPFVRMTDMTDSSIDFTVRMWVKGKDYWDVRFNLSENIYNEFSKNGIKIPFKQLDIHVRK